MRNPDIDEDDEDDFPIISAPSQAPEPQPIIIPTKTHRQLVKLADEFMQYMLIWGMQNQTNEYFLLKSASMGYTELAKIAILASANIHFIYENMTALKYAQANNHNDIIKLINEATMPPGPVFVEDLLASQNELHQALQVFIIQELRSTYVSRKNLAVLHLITKAVNEWETKGTTEKTSRIPALRENITNQIRMLNDAVADKLFRFVLTQGSYAFWQVCIRGGMPINYGNNPFGQTPLHLAATHGRIDIATLLIEAGADVNSQEAHDRNTPLMYATYMELPEMIAFLLGKGAKLHLKNVEGDSAASIAPKAPAHYVACAVAPHLFKKPNAQARAIAKAALVSIGTRIEPPTKIHALITSHEDRRRKDIENWKAWRNSVEGKSCMQRFYLQLLDCLDKGLPDIGEQLYKFAKQRNYTEICDVCEFLKIPAPAPSMVPPVRFSPVTSQELPPESPRPKPSTQII